MCSAGVRCVEIEATLKKITVLGNMDRKAVVKAVRKTGRRAELWTSSSRHYRQVEEEEEEEDDPPTPRRSGPTPAAAAASGFRFSCYPAKLSILSG